MRAGDPLAPEFSIAVNGNSPLDVIGAPAVVTFRKARFLGTILKAKRTGINPQVLMGRIPKRI